MLFIQDGLFKFAHEVYVLTPQKIAEKWDQKLSLWQTLSSFGNMSRFLIGSFIILGLLSLVLFLKTRNTFKRIGRFIDRATVFAPDVIRVAFGVSLIMSGLEKSLYGPELPLELFPASFFLKPLLIISGIALIVGWLNRWFAMAMAGLWALSFADQGWYMLNYINYFGEAVAVMLLPAQTLSVDGWLAKKNKVKLKRFVLPADYYLSVARILFGFSIIFAAIQVKVAHTALSYEVVNQYHLTQYFQFDPLFVVLGAALIESLIGILYIFGLMIRFNTIVFLIFLTLSITFFKESVWPHYLLIGLGIGIFLHRPDNFTLDKYLFAKRKRH